MWVSGRGVAERAALGHDGQAVAARFGVGGETVRGEGVGDGGERGLHRPMALGRVDALGQLLAVLEPDLVGQHLGLSRAEGVEGAGQQPAEQVVVLEGEREGGVERSGEVALRRTAGGADRLVARRPSDLDVEVPATGQLLQVVTGHVGVQREPFRDLGGGGPADARIAHEQVDLAAGRVAERVRDRAHHRVELVRGEGCRIHVGILPIHVVEMSGGPMAANDSDIWAALTAVEEPELRRSIVELGMVKGVALDGRTAVVALALPLVGEATKAELSRRVVMSSGEIEGIDRVDVDVREMTERELREVAAILKGQAPPNPLQVVDASAPPSASPRVNPFTDSRTRVIAVASGKGGVGKSSVTTNLAVALA